MSDDPEALDWDLEERDRLLAEGALDRDEDAPVEVIVAEDE